MKFIQLPLIYQFKNYGYNPQAYIGKGSYGQAYLGKDTNKPENENLVAIKKINLELLKEQDDYLYQCVFKEIDIQKKCNNPNVLSIIDHHQEDKYLYIVLPFCNGGDLGQELIKKQHLPENEAIIIIRQIVNGIKELHSKNIVHRDLKPDNIFIHDGVYKIADFGFARIFKPQDLMSSFVGTPLYESLQILENVQYSEVTDIWSLGLIYYEMLFGTIPWDCQTIEELISKIKTQPVRFNFKFHISEKSKDFILKCLQAKEGKRLGFEQVFKHKLIDCSENMTQSNKSPVPAMKKIYNNIYKMQVEYYQKEIDIKQIFKKVDQDNDVQSLNFTEFKQILKEFNQTLSLKDQKELFTVFDINGDGLISFKEFEDKIFNTCYQDKKTNKMLLDMKANKIIKKLKGIIQNQQLTIDQIFSKFNHNHKEFNYEDFNQLLLSIDSNIKEQESKQVFDFFDKDHNKQISKTEFKDVIYKGTTIFEVDKLTFSQQQDKQLVDEIVNMKRFIKQHDLKLKQVFMYNNSFSKCLIKIIKKNQIKMNLKL